MTRASESVLRKSEWRECYRFTDAAVVITHFECVGFPGVVMSHAKWRNRPGVSINYATNDGHCTDSLWTAAKRRNKVTG